MQEEKLVRKKPKMFEKFSILILVATLFMSVAYANISDIKLDVTGELVAQVQSGVFISDIIQKEATGTSSQSINYYSATLLSTTVNLSSSAYITYEVSLYNNSGDTYYFEGLTYDEYAYDNTNILVSVDKEAYVTKIEPRNEVEIYLTFKNTVKSIQELNSLIKIDFNNEYIDFSIDKEKYTVPNGISWEQFVNSDYANENFEILDKKVNTIGGYDIVISSGTPVTVTDKILEKKYEYESVKITFERMSDAYVEQGEVLSYKAYFSATNCNISNDFDSYIKVLGKNKNYNIKDIENYLYENYIIIYIDTSNLELRNL